MSPNFPKFVSMEKKECPSCAMPIEAQAKVCPICAYEFPSRPKWQMGVALLLILALLLWIIL